MLNAFNTTQTEARALRRSRRYSRRNGRVRYFKNDSASMLVA